MNKILNFMIDGVECISEKGQYLLAAAHENGIYIPSLCNIKGLTPRGACRVCTVKVNGRLMTACTTPVTNGMQVENNIPELNDLRKSIIEMYFVEGNHFCPACEKSGNCELQALAYRMQIAVPRFPYQFQMRNIEADNPKFIKDHNRCILCKRCVRAITDDEGRRIFAYKKRGHKMEIGIDKHLSNEMTDEMALKAMNICPVGAILVRNQGFNIAIGERKYDKVAIGTDIESFETKK